MQTSRLLLEWAGSPRSRAAMTGVGPVTWTSRALPGACTSTAVEMHESVPMCVGWLPMKWKHSIQAYAEDIRSIDTPYIETHGPLGTSGEVPTSAVSTYTCGDGNIAACV